MLVPIGHVVPHQLHGPCVVEVHRQQVPRIEELGPWQGGWRCFTIVGWRCFPRYGSSNPRVIPKLYTAFNSLWSAPLVKMVEQTYILTKRIWSKNLINKRLWNQWNWYGEDKSDGGEPDMISVWLLKVVVAKIRLAKMGKSIPKKGPLWTSNLLEWDDPIPIYLTYID